MKNLKTKIGLSVLALACLGAGALNLQPNVSAYAEESTVNTTTALSMKNGAEISVESDFNGIRWATTVEAGYLADESTQFGVIVAPTKNIVGEFTHGTEDVLDLAFEADTIDTTNEATYYSVIDYSKLTGNFNSAYALELTARAYVKTTAGYIYADLSAVSTARSARQVAINAEFTGQLDGYRASEDATEQAKATKAVEYYGGTQYVLSAKQKDYIANNVFVVDKENYAGATSFAIDLSTATPQEVIIGAESVAFEYADGVLNVKDVDFIEDGEHYMTIFTDSTDDPIIVKPFIYATKVIRKAEDLQIFNTKGDKYLYSTKAYEWDVVSDSKPTADQVYDGYYVLGNSFDATYLSDGKTAYYHGSRNSATEVVTEETSNGKAGNVGKTFAKAYGEFNNSTWNGATAYQGVEVGLTGTFNGLGYQIENLWIGTEREGIFGIINGGTVKNVSFSNMKRPFKDTHPTVNSYPYVLATYLIDAKVENVRIHTYAAFETEKGAIFGDYAINTTFTNCFLQTVNYSSTAYGTAGGALFMSNKFDNCSFNNVYVIASAKPSFQEDFEFTTYEIVTTQDDESTPDVNEEVKTTYYKYKDEVEVTADNYGIYQPMILIDPTLRAFNKETGEYTKNDKFVNGVIVFAENQVKDANAETLEPVDGISFPETYSIGGVIKGVFAYVDAAALKAAVTDYSAFTNATQCWYVKSGALTWKTMSVTSI